MVKSFKYLGMAMTASDNDWPAVVGNLRKDRKSWACTTRIMGRERAIPRVFGEFSRRFCRRYFSSGQRNR